MSDPGGHLSLEQRVAFRAFVRDHHPDRGGDPAVFAAGVDRFRTGADGTAADVVGTDAGRPAEPMSFPVRLGVALIRTWRRRHDPPGPS